MADYQLIISRKALEDFKSALTWYEDKGDATQANLIDELDLYYKRIVENPERYGYFRFSIKLRRALLQKFPFLFYIAFTALKYGLQVSFILLVHINL